MTEKAITCRATTITRALATRRKMTGRVVDEDEDRRRQLVELLRGLLP